MFSRSEKYIVEQRGNRQDKENRAGYLWYETKTELSNFVVFLRNLNNKYNFVAL